jgi:hypothetical protein
MRDNVSSFNPIYLLFGEGKGITGRGDPYGCETSRFPHFLENLLKDGGEFVCLTRQPTAFHPRKIDGTPFLLEVEMIPEP